MRAKSSGKDLKCIGKYSPLGPVRLEEICWNSRLCNWRQLCVSSCLIGLLLQLMLFSGLQAVLQIQKQSLTSLLLI